MQVKYFIVFKNGQWLAQNIFGPRPSIAFIIKSVCNSTLQREEDIVSILVQEFN